MRRDERPIVHPADVIPREDQVVVGGMLREVTGALAHGIGRALEPMRVVGRLFGRQDLHEATRKLVETVGARDVAVQRRRVELGQHENPSDLGVQAAADGDVDQPVLAADGNRGLRPGGRQGEETGALSAPENDSERVGHGRAAGPESRDANTIPRMFRDCLLACAALVTASSIASWPPGVGAQGGPSLDAAACGKLTATKLPGVTVTSATPVAAGQMPPPPARGGGPAPQANPFADLPAVCRVAATLKPSSDSDIKMELWLPASWNGKFRGTGNGGLGGGTPSLNALAGGVRRGYATAAHNTGHAGDSSYAMDHPEQIKDFGYRATHEMTVRSQALIRASYGKPPSQADMAEGGGGTRAALSPAHRYPEASDTLAVTGMSSYLTRHTFAQMWVWQATHQD